MPRPDPRGRAGAPALFFLLLLLLFSAVPSGAADTVAVDVAAVYASNDGTSIDPALGTIRGKLRSMFNYTSYRMLDRKRRTLSVGETGEFELPGRRTMRATSCRPRGTRSASPYRSPRGRGISSPPPSDFAGGAWSSSAAPPTRPAS